MPRRRGRASLGTLSVRAERDASVLRARVPNHEQVGIRVRGVQRHAKDACRHRAGPELFAGGSALLVRAPKLGSWDVMVSNFDRQRVRFSAGHSGSLDVPDRNVVRDGDAAVRLRVAVADLYVSLRIGVDRIAQERSGRAVPRGATSADGSTRGTATGAGCPRATSAWRSRAAGA